MSLEDDLILQFGIDKAIPPIYRDLRQDEALGESVLYSKITHIQRVMMGQNFHIRQELNGYSDMVEEQRRILYAERLGILKGETPMSPSGSRYGFIISTSSGLSI